MRCPHCSISIHEEFKQLIDFNGPDGTWSLYYQGCPECKKSIIKLKGVFPHSNGGYSRGEYGAYPRGATLRPVAPEVPDPYKRDFVEACEVLSISPKASAALSRRNLQAIIRDKAGIKGKDLNAEIDTLIKSGAIPTYISEGLHAVRQIGNFAAHPIKSTASGELVDVEEGEADWNLDVLESLFDFYFIQPAITAKRKADLNKKLKEAGKPEIP
jgi:hypothetical protein